MRNKVVPVLCGVSMVASSIGLGISIKCIVDRTNDKPVPEITSTEAETTTSTTRATTTTATATTTTSETTVTTGTSTTTVAATTKKVTSKVSTTKATSTTTRATTTTTTAATTTTTASETTTEIDIPETTTVVSTETETVVVEPSDEFIGTFTRGTYYTFGSRGGSGRPLVSGYSIASRALYEMYGYGDYEIRIECDEFPALNGVYSLDDCSAKGDNRVIDFWFAPGDVPGYFYQQGVLEVRAYLVK